MTRGIAFSNRARQQEFVLSQHEALPVVETLDSYLRSKVTDTDCNLEVIYTVSAYVEAAKLALLKHRVRDFKACDVVALAAVMEQRDRAYRLQKQEG